MVGLSGIALFVLGLVATIVLIAETGQKVPDSECSDSRIVRPAAVPTVCYTSDDPAVLIGVAPTLAGIPLAIFGFKRWASAKDIELEDAEKAGSSPTRADDGSNENPLQKIINMRKRSKGG